MASYYFITIMFQGHTHNHRQFVERNELLLQFPQNVQIKVKQYTFRHYGPRVFGPSPKRCNKWSLLFAIQQQRAGKQLATHCTSIWMAQWLSVITIGVVTTIITATAATLEDEQLLRLLLDFSLHERSLALIV